MEYLVIKEDQTNKALKPSQKDEIVKSIYETFDRLNTARQKQSDDIKKLQGFIFPVKKESENYKSHDMFEIVQTFKAAIWENLYSNIESLFDVSGQDEESEANSYVQKANLVHQFEKAKLQKTIDKCIDYLISKSEFICFVGWKKTEKQIRRKEPVLMPVLDEYGGTAIGEDGQPLQVETGKFQINVKSIVDYDGVDFKAVDPESFVYDTENESFRIYQTFTSVQKLRENKLYDLLTDTQAKELEELTKDPEIKTGYVNKADKEDYKNGIKGNQVEVLEYWGDLKLKDGLLKNYVVVVVARKYVIRYESNPYLNDPFVICDILKDPETKRGYLYLLSAIEYIQTSENLINDIKDAVDLTVNPPYLAPKGAMTGRKKLKAGDIVEYDPLLMPKEPSKIEFNSALNAFQFVEFLKAQIESTTGVFKNMAGVNEGGDPTATEIKARVGGQNSRLSMIIDTINQNGIIPIIEKAADLEANYNFDDKQITVNGKAGKEYKSVTPDLRQGNYKYTYGDRNDMQLKKLQQEQEDTFIERAMQHPAMMQQFNVIEYVKYRLEQNGAENVEKFFNAQSPQQIGINPNEGIDPLTGMEDLQGLPQNPNIPPSIQPAMQ